MADEAKIITFSGRVQGVGFRQTVRELARDLTLSGTVCNCADGRVKLAVQGSAAPIDKLRGLIQARFERHITQVEESQTALAPGKPSQGIRIVHE
jgi:acylphosphatase